MFEQESAKQPQIAKADTAAIYFVEEKLSGHAEFIQLALKTGLLSLTS